MTGLVVATDAYISSRGTALGLATLQWAAVSQATDDTAIDISGYRVEYRKNLAGAPWVSGGVTDAQRLTLASAGSNAGNAMSSGSGPCNVFRQIGRLVERGRGFGGQ